MFHKYQFRKSSNIDFTRSYAYVGQTRRLQLRRPTGAPATGISETASTPLPIADDATSRLDLRYYAHLKGNHDPTTRRTNIL